MSRKFPAKRITLFAVYKKFMLFGNWCRTLEAAFPDRADAEKWIEDHCKCKDDYMVEEMQATMKSWQT